MTDYEQCLYHHGILGQKWGIRRYQNKDGSYTNAGAKRHAEQQEDLNGGSSRRSKLKTGMKIAAGAAVAAGVGYALYKTGAGEKAFNAGKKAVKHLINNGKMSEKASKAASKATSKAVDDAPAISIPLNGKKAASGAAKKAATNITESGQGMSIPLHGKKAASEAAKKAATNITESGQGMSIPIKTKPVSDVSKKAASSVAKTPTANTGRKVAIKVIADNSDVSANAGDSFTFSPRAQRNMNRARKASNSLDASTDSMLSFSAEALRKMGMA